MNDHQLFDETLLRASVDGPAPEVRHQVLSLVSSELRSRRRDRHVGWCSIGLVVFAIGMNLFVGQRESARMARWHGTPATNQLLADSPVLLAKQQDKPTKDSIPGYFETVYHSPRHASSIDANGEQIAEWIRQFTAMN